MLRSFPKNIISEINDNETPFLNNYAEFTALDLLAPDYAYEGALPIDEDPADFYGMSTIKAVRLG